MYVFMWTGSLRGQNRELDLQVAMSCPTVVLGADLWFFALFDKSIKCS